MNRLQTELHRLYLPLPQAHPEDVTVRALVMELARPPGWELLSKVWQGVQAELELPAPAIAVSGLDGLQLWFSLAQPVASRQAQAFLEALRVRFLPGVDSRRVRLMLAPEASVPALQEQTGNWSAFVAADLAPIFSETPWLDIPPNEEGQAHLLRGLSMIKPAMLEEALRRLAPTPGADAPVTQAKPATTPTDEDPKRFLLRVMNDDTVALALRIEAAKALLQQHR
jgi:hypothetical protein